MITSLLFTTSGISTGSVFSNLYPAYLSYVFISVLFTFKVSGSNTCTSSLTVCVSFSWFSPSLYYSTVYLNVFVCDSSVI